MLKYPSKFIDLKTQYLHIWFFLKIKHGFYKQRWAISTMLYWFQHKMLVSCVEKALILTSSSREAHIYTFFLVIKSFYADVLKLLKILIKEKIIKSNAKKLYTEKTRKILSGILDRAAILPYVVCYNFYSNKYIPMKILEHEKYHIMITS